MWACVIFPHILAALHPDGAWHPFKPNQTGLHPALGLHRSKSPTVVTQPKFNVLTALLFWVTLLLNLRKLPSLLNNGLFMDSPNSD